MALCICGKALGANGACAGCASIQAPATFRPLWRVRAQSLETYTCPAPCGVTFKARRNNPPRVFCPRCAQGGRRVKS